jgi:cytochrome c553
MKLTSTILLSVSTLFLLGCSDSNTQQIKQVSTDNSPTKKIEVEVKKKDKTAKISKEIENKQEYTLHETYEYMCKECHSKDGSGNPDKLTPSMVDNSQDEIYEALVEVEEGEGHIIMEYNHGEIIKMGMQYPPKDMAKYMYERFHN